MSKFKITWKQVNYGESFIEAENEEEALALARQGFDSNFNDFADTYNTYPLWNIDNIEEVEN